MSVLLFIDSLWNTFVVMVESFNFVIELKTKSGSLSRHTIVDDEGHFSIVIFYVELR